MSDALKTATAQQRIAAQPGHTRIASANAGSGKTKVLVDRVSRLLLKPTAPDKILCLTYTKAAASEMMSRLYDQLGEWSVLDDAALRRKLIELVGEGEPLPPLSTARGLFAKALDTPEGLKVQTIHAFCQRVLARFPMEAGILPGFEQLEDSEAASIQSAVTQSVLHDAYYSPEGALAAWMGEVSARSADQTLDKMFAWMGGHGREIELWTTEGGLRDLAAALGVGEDADAATERARAWAGTPKTEIERFIPMLAAASTKTEPVMAAKLADMLARDCPSCWGEYSGIYLTQKGEPRAGVVAKGLPADVRAFFGCKDVGETEESRRVQAANAAIDSAHALERTRTLRALSADYVRRYALEKRRRRVMDFDDMIDLTHRLLNRSDVRAWVLYKLDGGVEHILIDEAQDTAPVQWDIIDALREGFDPPAGDGTEAKTFFAVGDEKQSIYSFQGARPEQFIHRNRDYVARQSGKAINLAMSFRSAPAIMDAVNAVFSGESGAVTRMFSTTDDSVNDVRHLANRSDIGRVELWDLAPLPEETEPEIAWDPRPVDSPKSDDPKETLARELAARIRTWLDAGEPVYDRKLGRTRPMRAGDILILVRGRENGIFDACLKHLKRAGLPVAGADRLVVSDAVVVKDLMALGRFALFPQDCLSLAEVLRSPFIDVSENTLFDLAHDRDGALWKVVQDAEPAIGTFLAEVIRLGQRLAPYEFYVRVLDMRLGGTTLRQRIAARLGAAALDPMQAFLEDALAYQRKRSADLQHFVQDFGANDRQIKRENAAAGSEIRIMTVHGAKGLESPVVILPDTTSLPKVRTDAGLVPMPGGGFAWGPKSEDRVGAVKAAYERMEAAAHQEYLRLLYVAMTRAESRLVICGAETKDSSKRHDQPDTLAGKKISRAWYFEVANGFVRTTHSTGESPFGEALIIGGDPAPASAGDRIATDTVDLPDWVNAPVGGASDRVRVVSPSQLVPVDPDPLAATDLPVRSPAARSGRDAQERRFARGTLIHRLLEVLPDLPADRRRAAADIMVAKHRFGAAPSARIVQDVMGVLANPDFAPIFGPGSRAEVSLAGTSPEMAALKLSGQIDRLLVSDREIVIVDYKSNRPPPRDAANVPAQYLAQMGAYRALAREIWAKNGERPVRCALLWTDTPALMWLEPSAMDAALKAALDATT